MWYGRVVSRVLYHNHATIAQNPDEPVVWARINHSVKMDIVKLCLWIYFEIRKYLSLMVLI